MTQPSLWLGTQALVQAVAGQGHLRSKRGTFVGCLSNLRIYEIPWTQHCCCSASQSCPTLCDKYIRLPCPSPSPGVCPSSCALHQWCCRTISSSDTLFSFCPQSFPATGTFPRSHLFISDDQNTGASASASFLPVNILGWCPFRLTGLISLLSERLSGVFFSTTIRRHQFFGILPSSQSSSRNHWKDHSLDYTNLCRQSNVSLLFNTLSRFVIAFLPRSNHLLFSWLQSVSAVILEPKKRKYHYFHLFPFYLPCNNAARCHDLSFFLIFSLKPALSFFSFTLIKGLFSSS